MAPDDDMVSHVEHGAHAFLVANIVVSVLGLVIVALRIYSRKLTGAGLGWDDWLIVAAAMFGNALLVESDELVKLGIGRHISEVGSNYEAMLRLLVAFRITFALCICLVKLSALYFYLRVFPTPWFRVICQALIGVVLLWSAGNVVQEFAVCADLEASWRDYDDSTGRCTGRRDEDIAVCVFNAVTDVVVLLLPLWPVWRLQMRTGRKVGLTALFLLGLVTTIVALFRLNAIMETDYEGNISGTIAQSINYAVIEPNLAVICISLPMLHPLYHRLRERFCNDVEAQQAQPDSSLATIVNQGAARAREGSSVRDGEGGAAGAGELGGGSRDGVGQEEIS